jgi:hypothetical protein
VIRVSLIRVVGLKPSVMNVGAKMNKVVLKVEGGIVEPIEISDGIDEVIVRDYDFIPSDIPQELIQKDEDGNIYLEIVYSKGD